MPPPVAQTAGLQTDFEAMVRALNAGATAPAPAAAVQLPPVANRFQVKGLALAGAKSVALIAVDGQLAKPFVIGADVVDGWTVRGVSAQSVRLVKSGADVPLDLAVPVASP